MVALRIDQVHIWTLHLGDEGETGREDLSDLLSAQEQDRVNAFHFDDLKWRYMRRRGLVRRVLAGYCAQDPQDLIFVENAYGKPLLSKTCNPLGLHVNWSVSGDLAVLACSRAGPIGVDIELRRPLYNLSALVADFFSVCEVEKWQTLAPTAHTQAFYIGWTRKEACVKAQGRGLSADLDSFSVSFEREDEKVRGHEWQDWRVRQFQPSPEHEAAVALCLPNLRISFFEVQ